MNTVMNQLSWGRSGSLSPVDPGVVSWPKAFGCSSSSARVTSLAAVSVQCIGIPLPPGFGCTILIVSCGGTPRIEELLDDGDSERRGGGSSTPGSSNGGVLDWSTGLAGSLPFVLSRFDFFEYLLL